MRAAVFGIVGGGIVLAAVQTASAAVNCEQVQRYLKTGRSVEDIAESMIVDVKEVKKCQDAGSKAAPAAPAGAPKAPAEAPGGAPAPK